MRSRWVARCLLIFFMIFAPACQFFQDYRPVTVVVRDAETKQPIPQAQIKIWYPLPARTIHAPHEASALTDIDGVARVSASSRADDIMLAVAAAGYMRDDVNLPTQLRQNPDPGNLFRPAGQHTANMIVELYAEPRPTVELVLPDRYRGLVRVKVQFTDHVPGNKAQRVFPCSVPLTGVAELDVPAWVKRFYPPDFRGRYVNGIPLSREADPAAIGLHWLRSNGDEEILVVGTQKDFEAMCPAAPVQGDPEPRPSRRGRGGGGGRHRRGMQNPGD
jgi:hypothetical protein